MYKDFFVFSILIPFFHLRLSPSHAPTSSPPPPLSLATVTCVSLTWVLFPRTLATYQWCFHWRGAEGLVTINCPKSLSGYWRMFWIPSLCKMKWWLAQSFAVYNHSWDHSIWCFPALFTHLLALTFFLPVFLDVPWARVGGGGLIEMSHVGLSTP